jgi:hypothetical protein
LRDVQACTNCHVNFRGKLVAHFDVSSTCEGDMKDSYQTHTVFGRDAPGASLSSWMMDRYLGLDGLSWRETLGVIRQIAQVTAAVLKSMLQLKLT